MPHNLLLVFLIIFGINLMPAFGPPSWAILVFFKLNWNLPAASLVVTGLVAAACGRVLLALAARHLGKRLPERYVERLGTVRNAIANHRAGSWAALGLFLVSPLPSAQLFIAAGLLEMPLLPITAAFVLGRAVSYSLYVTLATVAEQELGKVLGNVFGSPISIALQLLFLGAVTALPLVDWAKLHQRWAARRARRA